MMRIDDKVAIVTGSSSGIGLAITRRFLDAGGRVFGVDRSAADASVSGRNGFHHLTLDLTEKGAPEAAVQACASDLGPVDILINNAGIGNAKPLLETTDEDLYRYIAINLAAPFALCRSAIGRMRGRGGCVVNMASVFGIVGVANSAAYGVTKGAIAQMTRQFAPEFGRDGVRVNAIAPGLIASPLTAERIAAKGWFRNSFIDASPLGRAGEADEIAQAALFLSSPAAAFITGVVLPVDGGWSAAKMLPDPATASF